MDASLDTLMHVVGFCDPAGKPKRAADLKKVRARTAIAIVGADDLGRCFVLDAWAKRAQPSETATRIFDLQTQWNCAIFGIEANAMQEWVGNYVALEARHRAVRLPMREVHQPTNVDKLWRIRTAIQPLLARGQLIVRDDLVELHDELRAFPTGRTVDLVDAVASCINLLPARVTANVPTPSERDALEAYLHRAGVEPSLIAARMADLDRRMGVVRRIGQSTRA